MRKNQPPAHDIMLFQISGIAAKGSSRLLKFIQVFKRKMALASRSSLGMVLSDWYQANVRFQTCEVKINTTEAISAARRCGRTALRLINTTGRNERIGTDWSTSNKGSMIRSARRL